MSLLKNCAIVGFGIVTAVGMATSASALEYENGVRNSYDVRRGTYFERTNLQIDGGSQYNYNLDVTEDTYSIKVDLTAPNARLNFRYNGDGNIHLNGTGSTSPINPDPTLMLVESNTNTNINGFQSGFDNYAGSFYSRESGSIYNRSVEASTFLNY